MPARPHRLLPLLACGATLLAPGAAAAHDLRAMVTLRPRDPAALAAYARAVSTPGSPRYHHYLTVAGFARRFAPSPAAVSGLRARLRAEGLHPAAPTANGLAVPVRASLTGTPEAFTSSIHRVAPGAAATSPSAPGGGLVEGVVGLSSAAPTSSLRGRRTHRVRVRRPAAGAPATAPGPQPCSAARAEGASTDGLTADQVAARYGMQDLHAAGDEGGGVTVAVYELEPFSAADVAAYQACMGTSASVTTETVDGGAGSGPGSGEAATDVEDLIGLAPHASIRVYEGPPTGVGAYDTYSAIVSADAARVVSTSWGLCEAQLTPAVAAAENTLFQEAAVQGQTIVAASGDAGSDDCSTGRQSVDDPASQPWVTAVGGTSAQGAADVAWDDGLGAGGGGVSSLWARPAWQTAAQAQSAVTCGAAGATCREVPDISADADPDTGYVAFFHGGWRTVGGTSVASPTIAALLALAEGSPACAGHPLGFVDPALYALAADITDVTAGTNAYDGVPGFAAGPGYDMATGLGTPSAALGPALCGDSMTLATPAAQTMSAARPVSLALHATSARGAAIAWSQTGLPAGLALDPATGEISGAPTNAGRTTVTVTALDADGAAASATFAVTVVGAPAGAGHAGAGASSILVGDVAGLDGRVGRGLHLRIRAHDSRGRALRFSARGLPRGVRIDPRTGLVSGTPSAAGRAIARIHVSDRSGAAATALLHWRIAAARHRSVVHSRPVTRAGGQATGHRRR